MQDINQVLENARQAQSIGNSKLALQLYQQALSQYPNELGLHSACGNLCIELQRFEEAAGHFRHILAFDKSPAVGNALCYALQALGNHAHMHGQYLLAEACFKEALENQPANATYWYNLGNAQRELGKPQAALVSFQNAIRFNPNDADTYNNLGNILRELGKLDLAIANYKKALQLDPNLYHALVHLVHQKQHICDWEDINNHILKIREWVKTRPEAQISPFAFLAMPGTTAAEQNICASRYIHQHYADLIAIRDSFNFSHITESKNKPENKIKIGYLSADFRLHPLAFLITDLIEKHDRSAFEIYAYSYGNDDKTAVKKRLEKAFDQFYDIRHLNDIDAAKKINTDQIDILVDLTGYTQSSRTGIVALKPTPISINWLGFPGSMGHIDNNGRRYPLFDYLIADKIVAPDTGDFSEKLLYLPCYQPNSARVLGKPTCKTEHGLPDNAFVFCSFNQTFKITAEFFDIWMRLLVRLPNSVLWLLECNAWAKKNLQNYAKRAGVDSSRLIFADRVSNEVHLERQQHADLFLDTTPYNAHTTASDALWVGLPILTCVGATFSARVTASLLHTMQLPELICESLQTYEEKALMLASDTKTLMHIKQRLIQQRANSGLFDSEKFAHRLETQYKQVWQQYLSSKA